VRRLHVLVLAFVAALLVAPAAQAYTTFYGTVGPGTTIVLRRASGTVVKSTTPGNRTFVIRDRSAGHNFHLVGRGIDKRTGVAFVGKRTWSPLLLRVGVYTIVCDVHPDTMRRTFTVSR
jgi:plastocyanin